MNRTPFSIILNPALTQICSFQCMSEKKLW